MSDESRALDTREMSRGACSCGPANADDHMMATEVGSLQRIADSLERIEKIMYVSAITAGSVETRLSVVRMLDSVRDSMPGVPAAAQGQEIEPSEASELEGDRPTTTSRQELRFSAGGSQR